jgi:threonine aldolase
MTTIPRRRFLQIGGLGAGLGVGVPGFSFGGTRADSSGAAAEADERVVRLSGDGLGLTPAQYARLLTRLLDENAMTPDSYSLGGVVEQLEEQWRECWGSLVRSSCPPARWRTTWRYARWPVDRAV